MQFQSSSDHKQNSSSNANRKEDQEEQQELRYMRNNPHCEPHSNNSTGDTYTYIYNILYIDCGIPWLAQHRENTSAKREQTQTIYCK